MLVLLRDAPALFFDQEQWLEFSAHFETPEIALARLSRPPNGLGYYEDDDSNLTQSEPERGDQIERLFRLGNGLVGELKRKLSGGEIKATGVPLPWGNRVSIAGEEWARLWPNFNEDCALGELFGYSHVHLNLETSTKAAKAEKVSRLTAWLKNQAAQGESRKKILQKMALDHFKEDFRVREFDQAYTAVFQRQRGRPRRATEAK